MSFSLLPCNTSLVVVDCARASIVNTIEGWAARAYDCVRTSRDRIGRCPADAGANRTRCTHLLDDELESHDLAGVLPPSFVNLPEGSLADQLDDVVVLHLALAPAATAGESDDALGGARRFGCVRGCALEFRRAGKSNIP